MKMVAVCFVILAGLCYTLSTVTAQESPAGSYIAPPPCGSVCDLFCEFGKVHDSSGCPICECNPNPSPAVNHCPSGQQLSGHYCGRGGERCPSGYYCEIAPNDAYAVCCRKPSPFPPPPTTECPAGSTPIVPRRGCSGFTLVGQNQRCPRRSFCVPDPADGPGVCCQRRVTPGGFCRPVNPRIRCFHRWDQCKTAADCRRGKRCCPGPCGLQCQRPGWSRKRGGRRSD